MTLLRIPAGCRAVIEERLGLLLGPVNKDSCDEGGGFSTDELIGVLFN